MHKCQINKDSKHDLSTTPSIFFQLQNVNRFRIEQSGKMMDRIPVTV